MRPYPHSRPRTVGSRLFVAAAFVGGLLLSGVAIPTARASTITVTTTVDELSPNGSCSLREAVLAANRDEAVDACAAGNGEDTIMVPAGYYSLTLKGGGDALGDTGGDLNVTTSLILNGADEATTVIDAMGKSRVFTINDSVSATLTNITMRNGFTIGAGAQGGGIYNGTNSSLTIRNSTITGSDMRTSSSFGFAQGSGIYNRGTAVLIETTVSHNTMHPDFSGEGAGIFNAGTLTLLRSTVHNNVARGSFSGDGGGIVNIGEATLINSTISSNRAVVPACNEVAGGGIANGQRHDPKPADLTLINSTVARNHATNGDDCAFFPGQSRGGGGVANFVGTLRLNNTLIADNTTNQATTDDQPPKDCLGVLTSQGYNLIGDTSGCTIVGDATGNLLDVDPLLGPLQDNGGSTLTHAIGPNSPALDAGNPQTPESTNTACSSTDQRGIVRPQDGDGDGQPRCDIGSFERRSTYEEDEVAGSPSPVPTLGANPPAEGSYRVYLPFLQQSR